MLNLHLLNHQRREMGRDAAGHLCILGALGALAIVGKLLVLAGLRCRPIGQVGKGMGKRTLLNKQQREYQQYSGEKIPFHFFILGQKA